MNAQPTIRTYGRTGWRSWPARAFAYWPLLAIVLLPVPVALAYLWLLTAVSVNWGAVAGFAGYGFLGGVVVLWWMLPAINARWEYIHRHQRRTIELEREARARCERDHQRTLRRLDDAIAHPCDTCPAREAA